MFRSYPYLVYSKRHLLGVRLVEFLTPPPSEVDSIDQNQLGLCIDGVRRQQLWNLTLGRSREYKAWFKKKKKQKTLDEAHWRIPISSLEPKSSFQICPVWVVLHGTHSHGWCLWSRCFRTSAKRVAWTTSSRKDKSAPGGRWQTGNKGWAGEAMAGEATCRASLPGLRGGLSQEATMNGSEGTPSAQGQTSGSL